MDGYERNPVYCIGCGKNMFNEYKVATDQGPICIACLREDIARKKEDYFRSLQSTKKFTIAGIIFAVVMFVVSLLIDKGNNWTEHIFELPEIVVFLMILFPILELISFSGFFFGIRTVYRWISKWPVIVIVFSVLFFSVVFGLLLVVASWIGWIVMIKDWRKVKKLKKEYIDSRLYLDKIMTDMNNYSEF